MSRSAVDALVYLLDEAFEGKDKPWHSILGNLASCTEDDWLWTPPGGARSIRALMAHVGGAALLYYDRVFGGGEVFGDPPNADWNAPAGDLGLGIEDLETYGPIDNEPPMADVVAWVEERARIFRNAVAGLDDDGLMEERTNHRGDRFPIRWFIGVMIQHYAYHAGEINHVRALHQGNDDAS